MRGFFIVTSVFFLLHLIYTDVLARPEQSMAMTTQASKSDAMSSNSTNNDLGSMETADSEESLEDDDNDTEDEGDSQMPASCSARPPEIVDIEMQCMQEYKAMKKAKCNMTDDEKVEQKKMNTMESLESGMERNKRDAAMAEEGMNSTESMNITKPTANVHHRKRSCHYYQCILKKLDVLDESVMMPNEEMFKTWVSNNITNEDEKKQLNERVVECFAELHESGFYDTKADHNMNMSKSEEASVEGMKKGKTSCNAALKLLKCLSKQKSECPAFNFP